MKILAGEEQSNSGQVIFKGEEIHCHNPRAAFDIGISMIHQELSPILDMTIADNLALGREIGAGLFVSKQKTYKQATELLKLVNLSLSPNTLMKNLSVAQMQMVEICKSLSYNADILIMDEPTSAITDNDVKTLFDILRKFKQNGKSVIYISHKMDEIYEIADEISVFRDGLYIGTYLPENLSEDELIYKMVNRKVTEVFPAHTSSITDETALEVKNLSLEKKFKNISFNLRKGEILGFAGLMGSGRTEVVY